MALQERQEFESAQMKYLKLILLVQRQVSSSQVISLRELSSSLSPVY